MRDEEEDGIVREETSILKEGTKGGESLRGKRNRLKSERRRKKKGRKTDRRWVHLMMSDRFDVEIHPSSII